MNRRQFQTAMAALLAGGWSASQGIAAGHRPRRARSLPNIEVGTSGGQQMWTDVRYPYPWRIQCHALTGHYRLLDENDTRHAWGTLEACEEVYRQIQQRKPDPAVTGTVVLALHGLFRSRNSMARIAAFLEQNTPWRVLNFSYASTRGSVADHAKALGEVVDHLEGVEKIHFVAHSLGNLVIRRWINDSRDPDTDKIVVKRLGRMVMLGPPNNRPSLARTLVPIDHNSVIAGLAGKELNAKWEELAPTLATPPCEFGILAGGRGTDGGYNPLIPGDDDMIVGVNETKLPGARDFRLLNVIHADMMDQPAVQQLSRRFLEEGYFVAPDQRQPIT